MNRLPALLGAALRYAVAILALSTLTACAGLLSQGDEADPVQVTSEASAEAQPEEQPSQEQEPATEQPAEEATEPTQQGVTVEPGGTLVDGATVAGELTRVGQRDRFTLDLGDAREFYVTDMSGDDIEFQVYSEVDGEPVSPANMAMVWGNMVVKLTKAGAHRLEVFGRPNVVGPYRFTIATVKVRTFPVAIGMKIGEGSPDGAGRLDVRGRIDRFEFDSDGATAIKVVGGNGACSAIELELVDAAQTSVSTPRQPFPLCGYEFDIPLSSGDGRYALIVRSGAAKTGPYSFQIVRAG